MKMNLTKYRGHRFPPEIISHGVWMYHRFCLSLRDVEELLAKRGIHHPREPDVHERELHEYPQDHQATEHRYASLVA